MKANLNVDGHFYKEIEVPTYFIGKGSLILDGDDVFEIRQVVYNLETKVCTIYAKVI